MTNVNELGVGMNFSGQLREGRLRTQLHDQRREDEDMSNWITCKSCGRTVPADTFGRPFPHRCER